MKTPLLSLEAIRKAGLNALASELGPVGMIRFLQQYETGHGDYSVDRYIWLGDRDVKGLSGQIQKQRGESSSS